MLEWVCTAHCADCGRTKLQREGCVLRIGSNLVQAYRFRFPTSTKTSGQPSVVSVSLDVLGRKILSLY
jgi:hypothetical protein